MRRAATLAVLLAACLVGCSSPHSATFTIYGAVYVNCPPDSRVRLGDPILVLDPSGAEVGSGHLGANPGPKHRLPPPIGGRSLNGGTPCTYQFILPDVPSAYLRYTLRVSGSNFTFPRSEVQSRSVAINLPSN